MHSSALVLFSGGQDSTTCPAWSLARYPDCRDDTLKALQVALGLGLDRRLWGQGCGSCPACALRRRGYEAWDAAR